MSYNASDEGVDFETLSTEFDELKEKTFAILMMSRLGLVATLRKILQKFSISPSLTDVQQNQLLQEMVFISGLNSKQIWEKCMYHCNLIHFDLLKFIINETKDISLLRHLQHFVNKQFHSLRKTKLSDSSFLKCYSSFPTSPQLKGMKLIIKLLNPHSMYSLETISQLCQTLNESLQIPFVLGPHISPERERSLSWYVPLLAHTVLLKWGLKLTSLESDGVHIESILIDDKQYWLSKTKSDTSSPTCSIIPASFHISSLVEEILSASPLVTLTQVCSHLFYRIIEDNLQQFHNAPTNLTSSNMPEDVSLTLSYLGKLTYERSHHQQAATRQLIFLPPVCYGLGLTVGAFNNDYQTFLDILIQEFVLALYQTLTDPPRRFLNFGYIPHFFSGILKTHLVYPKANTNCFLTLFEAENSEHIKLHFKNRRNEVEQESSRKITSNIKEALTMLFGNDGMTKKSLGELSQYITGRLLYYSNSEWNIYDMTEILRNGVLTSAHLSSPSVSHESLNLRGYISTEEELKIYSSFPEELLLRTECLSLSEITVSTISLTALNQLAAVLNSPSPSFSPSSSPSSGPSSSPSPSPTLPGTSMQLVLNQCFIESKLSGQQIDVLKDLFFLKKLVLNNCIFDTSIVIAFAELITNSRTLGDFRSNCNISEDDTNIISSSIGKSSSLLSVEYKRVLTIQNAQWLFRSLQNPNSQIECVDLSCCSLTHHSADELKKYLEFTHSLVNLDISSTGMDHHSMYLMASGLKFNLSLKSLNVGMNAIGDEGANALSEALHTNACLEQLLAAKTSIGSSGLHSLAEALKRNPNNCLKVLDLSWNLVDDNGACSIANFLHIDHSLLYLDLTANSIEWLGVAYLAQALCVNQTLKTLHIAENLIDSRGMLHLTSIDKHNPNVRVRY